jgi:polyisoprenyl-teichoic acid--peptidoglycan teichoic acid transferase
MRRFRRSLVAVTAVAALLVGSAALAVDHLLLPDDDGEVLTLVLLGGDEGPPRGGDVRNSRADGFQLLFVSGDRQHATFVSIPRDSYVAVSGRGQTRIGHCLVGGPGACVATVEQEFGLEVDGYLLTSMEGFKQAVHAFGGLRVDVPTPVRDGGTAITEAGEQRLTGSQALTYARDRKNRSGGDVTRTQAQAELLALGHERVVAGGGIRDVLDALTVLRRHTFTDLDGQQLTRLGFEAMRLPPENVQRTHATGSGAMIGGASMYRLDQQAYARIADAAADGRLGTG